MTLCNCPMLPVGATPTDCCASTPSTGAGGPGTVLLVVGLTLLALGIVWILFAAALPAPEGTAAIARREGLGPILCACGQPAVGYAVPPPPASQRRGIPACRQFADSLDGWHWEPLDSDVEPFRSIAVAPKTRVPARGISA
jgi:hypothetical protein